MAKLREGPVAVLLNGLTGFNPYAYWFGSVEVSASQVSVRFSACR